MSCNELNQDGKNRKLKTIYVILSQIYHIVTSDLTPTLSIRMNKYSIFYITFLFCLCGCGNTNNITTIKLGHSLDVSHSVHKAMVIMDEQLSELSGGTMRIEIYPNEQLGTERQCLELLQIGSLGMTKVSVGTLENFSPKMKLFGLPFLFRNQAHAQKVMEGDIGKELLLSAQKYRLRGLTYFDAGSRSFYTKEKAINSPDDLKGMKIRVMPSVTAVEMVKQLGGSPTPISWGELYSALQQGIVDGAENNLPSFHLSRHYEVCKFYSLDEHTVLPDVLIMGTKVWERLSTQQQQWVQEAAIVSATEQQKLWSASEEEAMRVILAAGVEVVRPDKTLFSKKVEAFYEELKSDEVLYPLIERIAKVEN